MGDQKLLPFHTNPAGDIIGPGGLVFRPRQQHIPLGCCVLNLDGLNEVYQMGMLGAQLAALAPEVPAGALLRLNVAPAVNGQFALEVLDYVLSERSAGRDPDGCDISRQFDIPVSQGDMLHERLKEMGRTR